MIHWRPTLPRPPPKTNSLLGHYLAVGDVVTAVESKLVKPTPGTIAAQRTFGQRGEALHMKLRRDGSDLDVNLVRAAQTAPAGPKSSSIFVSIKPLTNWRGEFVPCMGAGPTSFAAIFRRHLVLQRPFQALWFHQNRRAGRGGVSARS